MPTLTEIRERADQVTSRLYVLANHSTQQVRALASRGADYVQQRFIAFNNTCRGRKNENGTPNWSSSDSENIERHRDSSKDQMKTLNSACRGVKRKILCSLQEQLVNTCFSMNISIFHVDFQSVQRMSLTSNFTKVKSFCFHGFSLYNKLLKIINWRD